jgi:hypothetical protein
MPRPEEDEDIVDKIRTSHTADALTIEAMRELIRIRQEMATMIRNGNELQRELDLCRSQYRFTK